MPQFAVFSLQLPDLLPIRQVTHRRLPRRMVLLFLQNHTGCTFTKFRQKTLRFVTHEYLLPHGSFCLHKTRGNSMERHWARLDDVLRKQAGTCAGRQLADLLTGLEPDSGIHIRMLRASVAKSLAILRWEPPTCFGGRAAIRDFGVIVDIIDFHTLFCSGQTKNGCL